MLVESTSGGCFEVTVRTVYSYFEVFEVFVFLQDSKSCCFEVADITAV